MLSDTTTLDVMPLPSVSNDPLATLLASTHVNMQSPTHRRRRRPVEVCTTGRDRSCGDNDRIMNTVYEGHGGSGAELGGDGEGGGELKVRMAAPSARRYSQPMLRAAICSGTAARTAAKDGRLARRRGRGRQGDGGSDGSGGSGGSGEAHGGSSFSISSAVPTDT